VGQYFSKKTAIGNKTPSEIYDTFMNNLEFKKQELLEVA